MKVSVAKKLEKIDLSLASHSKASETRLGNPATEVAEEAHYPTAAERTVDFIVHLLGLAFAVVGGGAAVAVSLNRGVIGLSAAITIYALGFIAMLALSTAYNFAKPRWQPLLFRVDHAGIFFMIAASYTPFTTQLLHGVWSWSMTITVWSLAAAGIIIRLFMPRLSEMVSTIFYLALGWVIVVAIEPLVQGTALLPLILLAVGGLVYTVGAVLFIAKRFKFRRAIWHGHVLAGAMTHYAAIMLGVVLVGAP